MQGEAFPGSFRRDVHSELLRGGSSATTRTIFLLSNDVGIAVSDVCPGSSFLGCYGGVLSVCYQFDPVVFETGVELI